MKKVILLLTICLSAELTFAQTKSASPIIYKVDTIQYPADKYKVAKKSAVYQLLKKMEGFETDSDGSITHQGQQIKKVNINGKLYDELEVADAIKKLPAKLVESIEMVDDYGDAARYSFIHPGPDKLLNINIKKHSIADLNRILASMHITADGIRITKIHISDRDDAAEEINAIVAMIAGPEPTVDDYGDQIPHFIFKPSPLSYNNKTFR